MTGISTQREVKGRAGDPVPVAAGYKRTDVGDVPMEWDVKTLGALSTFITKGSTPTTYGFRWEADGVLFLRSECVAEDGLDLAQSMFISQKAHEALKRGEVRGGDILMTITGNVGRVVRLASDFGAANINQHIARIRIVDPSVLAEYVLHSLAQPHVRRRYEQITTGQAYPQISLKQVRETPIPLPLKPEQRAIAEALSDVNASIDALDKLIVKKRAIMQGAMQQLLTGTTRLSGFGGEWEEVSMGQIGVTYGGLSGKEKADFGIGSARYIPFLNVLENVRIDFDALESVRLKPGERQNRVQAGDVLFNGTSETPGDLAMGAVVSASPPDTYLNSFCFGFRPRDPDTYVPLFIAYTFRGPVGRSLVHSLAQGATRYNLSKAQFKKLRVRMPDRDEQHGIVDVLSDMDDEIAALERRRDKTKALKRGMMQVLLTGRIRLVSQETAV